MNPLRVAAERAAHLAGDMLADDQPPTALTLAELHAIEASGGGITLQELLAEAQVLTRLAEATTRLGTPWAAALEVFTPASARP